MRVVCFVWSSIAVTTVRLLAGGKKGAQLLTDAIIIPRPPFSPFLYTLHYIDTLRPVFFFTGREGKKKIERKKHRYSALGHPPSDAKHLCRKFRERGKSIPPPLSSFFFFLLRQSLKNCDVFFSPFLLSSVAGWAEGFYLHFFVLVFLCSSSSCGGFRGLFPLPCFFFPFFLFPPFSYYYYYYNGPAYYYY